MYERMLVVLDGSKESESILGRAGLLAAKNGAEIVLLTVQPEPMMVVQDGRVIATLDQEAERMAGMIQPYLEGWKNRLAAVGVKSSIAVRFGEPARAIADYARWNDVGLIVMAARRKKGLQGLIRRSLADRVVHAATAPVLLMNAA